MILMNDFQRQWRETGAEVLGAVEKVGLSGWYILGGQVKEFESALAKWWGVPHAIGVASGLDGIELGLREMGCGPGDFVLTSPISAFATPLAILKLGATPVFADCDSYGMVDLEECRRILEARPEIRYFVPVHMYGYCLNMAQLTSLRDDFKLGVLEDCAQSIGSSHEGVICGSVGRYAATSFYPTKNLGALGDGGAVLCADATDAEKIRQLRDYGQSSKYKHDLLGYNSRLDEVHAAVLKDVFLPRLKVWTERRRQIATAYLNGITNAALTPVGEPNGVSASWHLFPLLIEASRKAAAMAYFKSAGVGVGEHYPMALIEQKALEPWAGKLGSACLNAVKFCHEELSLPIHPYLTDEEIEKVIKVANGWS